LYGGDCITKQEILKWIDLRDLHIVGDPQRLKMFFAALKEATDIVASSNIGETEDYEEPQPEQDTEKETPADKQVGEK